ncbi:iron ABC transporter permease [Brevibacillus centrosporus]|uniref:FecCD family ABC transporter permease n=1 Tax=Brevibacillus centrosporus TaxID=54910 RepID=UPI002E207FCB|nr:iron ABC transporter permease [Brevibacillus centrosporus]
MPTRNTVPVVILSLAPVAIVLVILLSVLYGAKDIDASTVRDAFLRFDPENVNHQIIMHSRIPRAVGALLIGAFLAISGALMQGMTRNYLASPSIMGVTDGSAFAITLCMVLLPQSTTTEMIASSLIGSIFAVLMVMFLSRFLPNGMTPVGMAIIGTITGTFLSGLSAAIATYFQVSQSVSFWYNARLHLLEPELVKLAIPFAVVGIVLAISMSKSITILALGEEISTGLGQRTTTVKVLATASVVILTGISVALAGKIAFVGLIIPHVTRFLVGLDYRWIVPCAGVLGGVFLGLCDVLSRFMNYPFETPIGVVTSIIGVPFFLYLIYKKGGGRHG